MKVIVGLGNPGTEYMGTRHNAGVMLVDKLSEKLESDYGWRRKKEIMTFESGDKQWLLVKSAGIFMNESGRMIHDLRFMNHEAKDVYIAHDDLDIRLGEYKIQFGRGPKEHGGVNSVEAALKTDQFWRIRIGIDNRVGPGLQPQVLGSVPLSSVEYIPGEEYVLQKFSPTERKLVDEVMDEVVKEIIG